MCVRVSSSLSEQQKAPYVRTLSSQTGVAMADHLEEPPQKRVKLENAFQQPSDSGE